MENQIGVNRRPRRRYGAEEKARIVGLYEQSGLTRGEFCRREGVSLFNLQRWLGKRSRAGEAHFVEIEALAIGKTTGSSRAFGWRAQRTGRALRDKLEGFCGMAVVKLEEVGEGLTLFEGDEGKEGITCERQIESGLGSSMAVTVFLPGGGASRL